MKKEVIMSKQGCIQFPNLKLKKRESTRKGYCGHTKPFGASQPLSPILYGTVNMATLNF
jgi:hypothetical protein